MNYWIKDFREELLATIREWDFLLINDSEARMLSGDDNLRKAASKILDMGPHTLVIKRGEYGAMLFRREFLFHRARLSAGRLSSIPPARAIVSPAASSATWPSRASIWKAITSAAAS